MKQPILVLSVVSFLGSFECGASTLLRKGHKHEVAAAASSEEDDVDADGEDDSANDDNATDAEVPTTTRLPPPTGIADLLTNQVSSGGGGNDKCKCANIDTGDGKVSLGGNLVQYPAGIGNSCKAWDDGIHPSSCLTKGHSPGLHKGWCADPWCYVDPCNCDILVAPKISAYFPNRTHNGHQIYYSYATCGAVDSWTTDNHAEACVNAHAEEECSNRPKCAWVGDKCLGKELAEDCEGERPTDTLHATPETVDAMMDAMRDQMNPDDPRAKMREELAAIDWFEDELDKKYEDLKEENYRAKIAIAQAAVAKESTPGVAEMLGDMRREMHALAAPFYRKVIEKHLNEIKTEKAELLRKMHADEKPTKVEPQLERKEAVPKTTDDHAWALFAIVASSMIICALIGYMNVRRM